MYNGFTKSNVNIQNRKIAYYEKGQGEVTCVFSCGWAVPFPLSDMYEIADILSQSCRCIVFDRFGYGFSDNSDDKRDFATITAETKLLCDKLDISRKVIFIGHSLSTFHALDFTKKFPSMVLGLVLIDGYNFNNTIGRSLLNWNWLPTYYFILLKKIGYTKRISEAKLKKILFGDKMLPDDILASALAISRERLFNKTIRNELSCAIKDLKHLYVGLDKLNNIPVIAICRNATYKNNLKLKKCIKNCTVVNLGKSTHFIHYIYPQKVAEQISKLRTQ